MSSSSTFHADAVLFDMDGTLTDSIAAVEAAWGKVAIDLGLDPATVIAATHGKRAIDNLAEFRPEIAPQDMHAEVARFEQTILDFADAFGRRGGSGSASQATDSDSSPPSSLGSSGYSTPSLDSTSSSADSKTDAASLSSSGLLVTPRAEQLRTRRPSFATRLSRMLTLATMYDTTSVNAPDGAVVIQECEDISPIVEDRKLEQDAVAAWVAESEASDAVDRSIRILPGVKRMIASIPEGRYAVATSGAKTYAYGAMTRVGIVPPPVTITADDARLKAGKPAPDPFLLAAACLGFPAHRCVVFEDSPSGIRAGVASGATVIAVCTSHARAKIEDCGAHYIVDDMERVRCAPVGEGKGMRLKFTVEQ